MLNITLSYSFTSSEVIATSNRNQVIELLNFWLVKDFASHFL